MYQPMVRTLDQMHQLHSKFHKQHLWEKSVLPEINQSNVRYQEDRDFRPFMCTVRNMFCCIFIYLLILLLSARWATVAMYNRRFRRCCYIRRRIYFVLLSILAPALNPSWLTKRVMCSESLFCSQGLYVLKSVISLRSTSLTPGRKQ